MNYNSLLENNHLEFQEAVSEKFMCLLCRRILRDPHIVPCGHSYCFICIKDHIKNERSFCIGDSTECHLESLDLSKNVAKDFRVNKEISELKAKCVNKNCSDFVEIKNLELHMQSCKFKITTCPFETVGCTVKELNQNDLKDHLVQSSLDHATIMTKCVEDLRNKNDEILLKIDHMEQQLQQLNNEVSQNIAKVKEVISNEKVKRDNKITNIERKIMEEKGGLKNEIMEEMENRFYLMKDELKKLSDKINEMNVKKIKRMNVGENYVVVDKEVKVTFDNVGNKTKGSWHKSDLFEIDKYSFKFGMCYESSTVIGFIIFLVEGKYDGEVSWPFKKTMQMEILNKDGNLLAGNEFNYETAICDWKNYYNKPCSEYGLQDSYIAAYHTHIITNNKVSVIIKMID